MEKIGKPVHVMYTKVNDMITNIVPLTEQVTIDFCSVELKNQFLDWMDEEGDGLFLKSVMKDDKDSLTITYDKKKGNIGICKNF